MTGRALRSSYPRGVVQADLQGWIASGNVRRAASSLVVDYGSDVFATCMAMVRNRTAAEDLTQDIFSDAIRGLSTYHSRPIVVKVGETLHVDDVKLLYYYQNRTAHIPVAAAPEASPVSPDDSVRGTRSES